MKGPKRSQKKAEELQKKFKGSAWKCLAYMAFVGYGLKLARDQSAWFWDPARYHEPYPKGLLPLQVYRLYVVEIAYYLVSIVTMFIEPDLKDFWIMFIHHVFTLTLLFSSLKFGATKYGAAIMILHDVADPLMELAKILLYLEQTVLANLVFTFFAAVFIVLRDYIYPRYIIWNAAIALKAINYQFRHPTIFCLTALWFLHLFWSVLVRRCSFPPCISIFRSYGSRTRP